MHVDADCGNSERKVVRTSRETHREVTLKAEAEAMRGGGRAVAAPITTRKNAIKKQNLFIFFNSLS